MIESWSSRRDELVFRHRNAASALEAERQALEEAQRNEAAISNAKDILQQTGQAIQKQVHDQIAGVVSRCLAAVFDNPYEFKIEFERKRGRTEARMCFMRDGHETDPLFGSGGGVVDVAAFALRVACMMMTKPPVRRIICADEPMKFVSKDLRPRVAELIESISRELEIQFLLISHDAEFKIGEIVEVG